MNKLPIKFNRAIYTSITNTNKRQMRDIIDKADKLKKDLEKNERLKSQECSVCFYIKGRVSGATTTETQCGICSDKITHNNTAVDCICKKCSSEHDICVHCGGDLNNKVRRNYNIPST